MADEARTILVVGAGRLGAAVIDALAVRYPSHRYVLASRDADALERRLNLTRYVCSQWGRFPSLEGTVIDLVDLDHTAAALAAVRPNVVFNATTPFPWWRIAELSNDSPRLADEAGPGMWCALDCVLPHLLCSAIAESGIPSPVYVNGCYPDMVNAFLAGRPGAPVVGIGNLSNLIPGLKLTFARRLQLDPSELDIRLVAHHYISLNAPTIGGCAGVPYWLGVATPTEQLVFQSPDDRPFADLKAWFSRVRGVDGQAVTVASAATVLASFLNGDRRLHHGPGPLGLPGGYPFEVHEDGSVSLCLPATLSTAEAVAINTAAQVSDGIRIVEPGRVEATEDAIAAHLQVLGSSLPPITVENLLDVALDDIDRLNGHHGLGLRL